MIIDWSGDCNKFHRNYLCQRHNNDIQQIEWIQTASECQVKTFGAFSCFASRNIPPPLLTIILKKKKIIAVVYFFLL